MKEQNIEIFVYLVPGGKQASQKAYQQLVDLCQSNTDFLISAYRGFNRYDGKWHIVLIGQPASFVYYKQQVQAILIAVAAQPMRVPVEGLVPLVERFFHTQDAMKQTGTTFFRQHHALPRDYPRSTSRPAQNLGVGARSNGVYPLTALPCFVFPFA